MHIVYSNKTEINIGYNRHQPPGGFVCIADYDNSGGNKLVISEPQSDVSDTRYQSYVWDEDDEKFTLKDRFTLMNGPEFVTGSLEPFTFQDQTYLLCKTVGPRVVFDLNALLIKDNTEHFQKLLSDTMSMNPAIIEDTNNTIGLFGFISDRPIGQSRVTYLYKYYRLRQ